MKLEVGVRRGILVRPGMERGEVLGRVTTADNWTRPSNGEYVTKDGLGVYMNKLNLYMDG